MAGFREVCVAFEKGRPRDKSPRLRSKGKTLGRWKYLGRLNCKNVNVDVAGSAEDIRIGLLEKV